MDKLLLQELQEYVDDNLSISLFEPKTTIKEKPIEQIIKINKPVSRDGLVPKGKPVPVDKLVPKVKPVSKDKLISEGKPVPKTKPVLERLEFDPEHKRIADQPPYYMQSLSLPKVSLAKAETEEKKQERPFIIGPEDLKSFVRKKKNKDTFTTKLLKYIDQTGSSDSEIYKRAGIDRRHFSKIRCNKEYKPKKSTAIALCLALRLSTSQAEELLGLSGYTLSNSDTSDLVVRFCIEKGIYDLLEVNDALDYFGEKAIGVIG